jgi:hypothetical protein
VSGASRTFVGRERELSELLSALEETRAGRGGLFLLAGEAGIGKTRVADELSRRASSSGFDVRWGRCWEVGGAPAYWPWIQVLRGLLRDGGRAVLEPRALETLAGLLPELCGGRGGAAADGAHERFELFEAVSGALRAFARGAPRLVILDDLHAADPSSLALLLFVARELRDAPLCILGTVRDHEARASGDNADLFGKVAREATFMTLGRLEKDEVRALLAARGSAVTEELVAAVVSVTEGHPLFIEEVRRALGTRSEALVRGKLPVPPSVRAAIGSRVALLDAATRDTLAAASVLGRDFSRITLSGVLERSPDELREPIQHALAHGMLLENEPGSLEFSHALVREELYRSLPEPRRADLHARAAAILEHAGALESSLGEVATHLLAGSGAVGAERALAGAERAARRALSRFAFEDAAAIMQQALAALEPSLTDRRALCRAYILLGEARVRMHADGRAACTRAAAIARELGDSVLIADAGLALGAEISIAVVSDTLVSLLEEALGGLPSEPSALRARVLARLAAALQPAVDPRVPVQRAREAIEMARSLGDSETLRVVLYGAGAALVDYAPPEERIDVDQETLRLAQIAGDRLQAFRARLRLFVDHMELGEVFAADAVLLALTELAHELGRPRQLWYAAMFQAARALLGGRFADADRWLERALEVGAQQDDPVLQLSLDSYRLGDAMTRGETNLRPWIPSWPPMLKPAPLAGVYPDLWAGYVLAHEGNPEAALGRIAHLSVHEPAISHEPVALNFMAQIYILARDRAGAEAVLPYVAERRGHFVSWGIFGLCTLGPFTGVLARIEALLGRWSDAERDFRAAIAEAARAGAFPALAEMYCELARALLDHGGADQARAARRELLHCLELARERELELFEARARHMLSSLDERPAPAAARAQVTVEAASASAAPRPGTALEFSLTREGDVWLVARGAKSFRLKDSRGLQMLSVLIESPGRELHALALGGGGDPATGGDAGSVIDLRAAQAYRERLEDLRDAERDAEDMGDSARLSAVREEIEQLAQQLAAGVGLGGRERRAASVAERARTNVQRRLKDAISRIEKCDPELGRYLSWTVRTGTFCVFDPGVG